MSDGLPLISPDSAVCATLSCLPEKFVVDFANGIDVARDHSRVQCGRSDFFSRMYDGFTGQGARRQIEINASLVDGVEASLHWLGELSESLARSNLAITKVNERVTVLSRHLAELVHYSADTRERLNQVEHRLDARIQNMTREVARIDFIQKAQLNLDSTFSKWMAGSFAALSPAARCYAALEELRWGPLGDYCRSHNGERQCRDFMQLVVNRATAQLAADAAINIQEPADMRTVWLSMPPTRRGEGTEDLRQALSYLADGLDVPAAPLVNSAMQQRPASPRVPLIANARRVAEALVHEVFPQETIDG